MLHLLPFAGFSFPQLPDTENFYRIIICRFLIITLVLKGLLQDDGDWRTKGFQIAC